MLLSRIKIDERLLREERLKGARVLVHVRWAFASLVTILLIFQSVAGYAEESRLPFFIAGAYFLLNFLMAFAARKQYDPRWLRFVSATFDLLFIVYHIFMMTVSFDHTAATAAATLFLIPFFFLLYTMRLDRGLIYYMIVLALAGFNFTYFYSYISDPSLYAEPLSITPLAHLFKSVYIALTGLLVIYLQHSLYELLHKQITIAAEKVRLNTELQTGREQNEKIKAMAEQERSLNRELAEEIRKKDEYARELKETQTLVNTIMSNLLGAVSRCLYDDRYTAKFYSSKIEDITGYASDDFIDNKVISIADLILPEDADMVRDAIERAIVEKSTYSIDFRIRHRNGNIVWVNESGQLLFDKDGKLKYLDGITTDITSIKHAQQSFSDLTELLPQTVYELDNKGYVVFANKAADELFGKGVPDETGRIHASQFFAPGFAKMMLEKLENMPEEYHEEYHEERNFVEAVALRHDGTECPVLIYSSAIVQDGILKGERGIIVDISEVKKTEGELKKAKEELELLNSQLEKTVTERTQQLTEANTQLLRLQKENLQSQFEVLKQQVNPHFLFNSLNVLTSLIKVDADLAESFTEQLSKVYRYVLENKERDLVPLATEMEFLKAYAFLLDIRFTGKVFVETDIPAEYTETLVLPLALQLLIENAIKHNTFSRKSPLKIKLFIDSENYLNVTNNLQSRSTAVISTGIGLVNIARRYKLLAQQEPLFEMTDTEFVARIPLIDKPNR